MASLLRCSGAAPRQLLSRRNAIIGVTAGLGLTAGGIAASRQQHFIQPMRLDSLPPASSRSYSTGPKHTPAEPLNSSVLSPEVIKQLSGGSLSGFAIGVLVSVFSKTLVLLLGLGIVAIQVASRYGINLVDTLKLRKRFSSSKILSALDRHAAFKLAFGLTFALSAFTSF
ncbi:hypothetical protein QBC46DRAFT_386719 [Diplogelasinospora grovesii]|uniref:Fun14 family protein n=1 Tax=Diplogelasinospora grovesii TaxID=303347 RepID=A0AAN6N7E1_9PEZI|nr:hypothetical protein QBC46DRAFT_386719 [Diplogelasinospora grovesii]